ncbi:MAG: tRNA pseudouridine(55) synthase TruB [Ignavibacteriales bacterium]|nr:tRNA pseudouridine(55) synthase TruB [Ignavibacteriales bacterium]
MWEHAGLKSFLDFDEGEIILVDKPLDWTSFDVVARVRSMFNIKKIGHAGTLDPKATGLLILCTGKKTKSMTDFQNLEKEYTGIIELGITTKSFDSETEIVETKAVKGISSEQIESVMRSFIGEQQQLPPMFSAIKKNGRRLYKDARKGREIERDSRTIHIKEIEMTAFDLPFVTFRVVCSKGTYIRSLAHDIGKNLGCGGYLKELTRTKIGDYTIQQAMKVEDLHLMQRKLQEVAV